MSVFSQAELDYLASQRLARIATAGPGGQPHVVPVAFRYNPETDTIDVGGHDFAKRKKWRDVHANPRVAITIDDLATVNPWRPRMIEVRGVVQVLQTGGDGVGSGFDPHTVSHLAEAHHQHRHPGRWPIRLECAIGGRFAARRLGRRRQRATRGGSTLSSVRQSESTNGSATA